MGSQSPPGASQNLEELIFKAVCNSKESNCIPLLFLSDSERSHKIYMFGLVKKDSDVYSPVSEMTVFSTQKKL